MVVEFLAQVYWHRPPNALDIWAGYFYHERCALVCRMGKTGEGYDELRAVFDKLSEGIDKEESRFQELHDLPFGTYGQFTDKFGVHWIFKADKRE